MSRSIDCGDSSFVYIWNVLKNPQTLLSQTISVNSIYIIESIYDFKKDQTTVYLKKKGLVIQKKIFSGVHIPKLVLDKGIIGYEL